MVALSALPSASASTMATLKLLSLRACPRSFGGFAVGCQPAHEQLDDDDDGHGGRGVDQALEVLGEAAVAAEPGEGALDHPAPWQQVEAGGVTRPLDDLELQSLARGGVQSDIALIAGIGEQVTEPGKAPTDPGTDWRQAVAILDAGRMDHQPQRQAQGVGEQMSLAAVDLLAGVEAALAAGFGGLDALAVDDSGTRRRFAAGLLTGRHEQRHLDAGPDAILPELAKIAIDRALGWELAWQHPPGAAGAQQIQQRVQHFPQPRRPPPATALGGRQQRLDPGELGVGHVGCVAATRAPIVMASGSSPHRS